MFGSSTAALCLATQEKCEAAAERLAFFSRWPNSAIDSNAPPGYQYSMTKLNDLTTGQIRSIIAIKEQIEALQSQINSIAAGGGEIPIPSAEDAPTPARRKYHMTAAHKRKLIKVLARARKIRWAKSKSQSQPAKKGKRRLSAAGRAAIIAATKARWAKIRGDGATKSEKPAKKKRTVSAAVKAKLAAIAKARWARAKAAGKKAL